MLLTSVYADGAARVGDVDDYVAELAVASEPLGSLLGALGALVRAKRDLIAPVANLTRAPAVATLAAQLNDRDWATVSEAVAAAAAAAVAERPNGAEGANNVDAEALNAVVACATLLAIVRLSGSILASSLATMEEINYYEEIMGSSRFMALYAAQTLPRNCVAVSNEVAKRVAQKAKWLDLKAEALDSSKGLSLQALRTLAVRFYALLKNVLHELTSSMDSPVAAVLKSYNSVGDLFRVTLGVLYVAASMEVRAKKNALAKRLHKNVQLLGWLLNNTPEMRLDTEITGASSPDASTPVSAPTLMFDFSILPKLNHILSHNEIPQTFNTTAVNPVSDLQELINHIPSFEQSNALHLAVNSRPGYLSRNWIVILPSIVLLPKAVSYLYTNRTQLYERALENARYASQVVVGFWKNWVLEPLSNVVRTIRHDPDSRLALMSERSLESDLGSLERMVVEYVSDNNIPVQVGSQAIDLTGPQRDLALQSIKSGVQHGDLTLLLKDYETALPHPIKELLLGQMLRNVLIQIQKTKVDGSVALSGIDKIVRSQELVFGCIAASPALFGLWLSINWGVRSFFNGPRLETPQKSEARIRARRALVNVARLVDNLNGARDDYHRGLLVIQVMHLEKLGLAAVPPLFFADWQKDVRAILNTAPEAPQRSVRRLWAGYGKFL